ncbi:BZ3501_MvSof-1269-A2-R1_Chr12-3g03555 [Microbotryum saponariae]|nr:BZ3501_MvSof-1269-A2-R1_Chr12-3g03555 [Microbotryum saponariae]
MAHPTRTRNSHSHSGTARQPVGRLQSTVPPGGLRPETSHHSGSYGLTLD